MNVLSLYVINDSNNNYHIMLIVLRSVDIVGSGINGPSFGGSDSGYDLGAGGPDMGVSGPSMMGSHVGGKLFPVERITKHVRTTEHHYDDGIK